MTKAFTKGQKVHYIARWDGVQFTVRTAIVYSCGKKRMVLTDAVSGKEMGRNFNPNGVDSYIVECGTVTAGTFAGLTDEEALAKAKEASAAYIKSEIEFYTKAAKAQQFGTAYTTSMADKLAEAKKAQPSAIEYPAKYR
jgi:predicted RNase H-like HicB family nuclease